MGQEPDSLAFRFAVVLVLATIVLAVTTFAAPPHPANDEIAPISPIDATYRPQYLNLY
jgi:hypothetical protein